MNIPLMNIPLKNEQLTVPGYSLAERDRRWNIGRQLMDEKDLEGLVVFGSREGAFPAPFSMDNYFTNDRPGAIVVFPRDGEPHVLAFALPPTTTCRHRSGARRCGSAPRTSMPALRTACCCRS